MQHSQTGSGNVAHLKSKLTKSMQLDTLKHAFKRRLDNANTRFFHRDSLVKNADTPYDVLYDDGLAKLRHYPALPNHPTQFAIPLLFVSPLAVNTKIYDLVETRSLIQFFLKRGFSVYLIDWGSPTRKHANYSFKHYATQALPSLIKAVRDYSGSEQISLHGWSMGGLFCLLYAAYTEDPHIKNMMIVGSPIDGHASGSLGKLFQLMDSTFRIVEEKTHFHPRKLPDQILHTRGWMNMLAFKAIDPIGTTKSYWHVLSNLGDKQVLVENATKTDFLNNMLDYPGGIIKDIGIRFWFSNDLIKGKFKLNDKQLDLKSITSNIFAVAGKTDTLVTSEAIKPITTVTSSTDVTFIEIPGGHVGIMASGKTSKETWPKLADWLAQRSH